MTRSFSQKTLLFAVLIVGSIIFALPYINMICTSVKMEEEMALGIEQFSMFPKTPIPRAKSPYVEPDTRHEIKRPVGINHDIWQTFESPFREQIRRAVDKWWGEQAIIQIAFSNADGGGRAAAVDALTNVVGSVVLSRISDVARQQGASAMLAEVPALITDDKIRDAFEEFMPRLVLGDVTVRLSDYSKRFAGSGPNWRAITANASTIPLAPPAIKPGQQAVLLSYDSPDHAPVSATMTPTYPTSTPAISSPGTAVPGLSSYTHLPQLQADESSLIDRIYIFYRPDQSWGRVNLLITLNGRQYQLAETLPPAWNRWQELEVRLPPPPSKESPPISGRSFFLLQDTGPSTTPNFSVTFTIQPTNQLGAWYAKIARNYLTAFRQVPIARYITTSLSLAILTILLTTFGSSLSAYAFARIDFPGRNIFFGILLATMMIPAQVTMIPVFLIHKSIGWYNTLYPLWVGAAFGSAFYIFMMRQFFLSIPKELEDAARIDGCGFFGIYWHIMLPLIRPTLVTVAIFAFMASWNNFMGPLIYLNDERLYNLAFGLYKFNLVSGTNNSLIMAGAFVMTLPIIALFFIFQRYFIRGIAISGLGGR
ncbi:MAG: carbohydrate ABC transporter permease [Phycisphaerales bacterium]|nr:carbohydrate ABC transporter permease [Phycisphaerales bacterium]